MNLGNRFPVSCEGRSTLPSDHWTNLGTQEMHATDADPRFPAIPEVPVMRNEGSVYIGDHSEMLGLQGGIPPERQVLQMNYPSLDDADGESWRDLLIFGSEVAQGTPTEEAIDEFDHEISVKGGYYQNLLKMSSNGNEYVEFQSPNSSQIQALSASQGITTSNSTPMTAIDGTPFQQKDAYNLNSYLGSESGIDSSCVGNRMEFAPETPNHGKQLLINHQLSDAQSFSAEESLPGKKDDGVVCTSNQGENPLTEQLGNLAELPTSNSTLVKEHTVSQEVGHGGIDLNKAPAQSAPRRRKHRPKVLREKTKKIPKPPVEGKPKRTPKPKNPDEKAPAKRKYVRKKRIETSVPKPGDEASGVRRGLSYDQVVRSNDESEKRTAANQQQSNLRPFDLNLSSQEVDGVQDITAAMERHKSACSSVQQLSPPHSHVSTTVRAHNFDVSARSLQTASTADKNGQFHLNQGYQPLNGEGKGKVPVQANVSADRSSIGVAQPLLVQSSNTVLKERSKRNHWQTSERSNCHPSNLMHSQAFHHEMWRTIEQDTHGFRTGFADLDSNKRKKFDNMPYAASFQDYSRPLEFGGSKMSHKSNSSSPCTYSGSPNINLGMQSTFRNSNSNSNSGGNGLLADRGSFTTLGNGFKVTRNVTWLQYHRLNMLKNYLQGAEALNLNATTGNETVTSVDLSQKRQMVKLASSIQPSPQKLHLNDHGKQLGCHNSSKKVKEPKRGKSYAAMVDELRTRLEHLAISASDKRQNALVPSTLEVSASDKGQNAIVPSTLEVSASDKGQNALVPLRLKHPASSASGEEQNALVPYKGDDRVVPYVDPIKKSKPRPRVDLDPETTRLWNLLMGKADSESAEPMDEDKERWWEGERKLVHGRVEAFIRRMHQFQGDRRFSEWKGSVLDSVIGVFLTQNVSDHLSSSAYISLVAKFPAKQNKPRTTCSDYESISWVEEPDVQIIDPDGTITYHGRKVMQPQKKQSSATLNGSSEGRPEILNWGTVTHCANENSSSREEDVISSESFCQSTKYTRSSPESEVDDHVTAYNSKKDGQFEDTHRTEEYTSLQQFHSQMMTGMLNDKSPMPDYEQPRDPASTGIFPKIFSGRNEHSDPVNPDVCCLQGPSFPYGCFCLNKTTDTGVNGSCCSVFSEQSFSSNSADVSKIYNATHTSKMNGGSAGSASYSTSAEQEITNNHLRRMDNLQPGLDFVSSQDSVNSNQVQASSSFHQEGKSPAEPARLEGAAAKETGSSGEILNKTGPGDTPNAKRKRNVNKAKEFDWDSLRRKVISEHGIKERTPENMDTLDYEALRHADVKVISRTILERGMNNMLAERIKDFLNRLVRDHGSTDLEWLRHVSPEQAKDYLLSVRGLGLKSVECVRLLTLHQVAFPVDTNVGRIAVRLGWVPLQPLPESLQLHLLELYPILESIQKYLWPRLCKLDQRTLYELHYQLITFGKVFCTKKKPNCNACPMRPECRHFASAFASARLALPAPGEKRMVNSTPPMATRDKPSTVVEPMWLLPACNNTKGSEVQISVGPCEPIVEEPASPEPEPASPEELDSDIEDFYYEDPDEIPTINLNFEEFKTNVENVIRGQNMGIQLGELSKALVALDASTASIPAPKLKNVSRLRTEHLVYELPDSHQLLKEMERREPDDPSPYLLAIWGPEGSTQRPEGCSHNHVTENSETVKGTLLIPCRTATRGSFPLNGTYFQVNEMFADDESSNRPIDVPREWLWKLPRRTVYFGTSVTSIFRGMSQSGIQYCFWKGFVCVRGFNRQRRTPKPLNKGLHEIASKVTKNKDNEDTKEPKKKEPKNKGTKETKNKGNNEPKKKDPKTKEPKKGNGEENNRLM